MEELHKGEARRAHMLHDPMRKLIPSVAIPSVVSMLITAVYNMADTFFVGQLGTSASGAVGIVFPIMHLLMALSFIFAHGASSYISRLLGGDETEKASRVVTTALLSAIAMGLVYGVAGLMLLDELLTLFGATPTILPYARDYARYIYIASPLFAGSFALNNCLRAEGSAAKSMIGMGAGAVLNILLDPICIFALDMGVAGAGFSTMIGQAVGFLLLLQFYLYKGKHRSALTLSIKLFTPTLSMYRELMRIGLPSFFRLGLNSAAAIVLNNAAAAYGDAAIAAFSIVTRILMLVNNALMGYGQGYQPISGYNFGAERYDRVRAAYRFTSRTAFLFMVIAGGVLLLIAPGLVALFRDDPEVIAVGARTLRYQAAALPLMSVTLVAGMLFQSTGEALPSFLVSIARQGLFFIPFVLLFQRLFGLNGLVAAQAAADALAFALSVPLLIRSLRRLKRMEEAQKAVTV